MTGRIAVLGAGAFGTALAVVMARKGHDTVIWGRNEATIDEINTHHTNQGYLGDIALPASLRASNELSDAIENAGAILMATPAQTTRQVAEALKAITQSPCPIVLCSKGIDAESLQTPAELAQSVFPKTAIAALSGPSFAVDIAAGLPTAVTLGASDMEMAGHLAELLSGDSLRIYASDDRKGVELGGALKNIIAIAVGICRGMGLGPSAEAALATRGFAEIQPLAEKLGARSETLMGLSGFGDLMLTCSSPKSRNFSYGMALGEGRDVSNLPLAEGAKSVFMADKLARQKGIDCPIIAVTGDLVAGKIAPREALLALLQRPLKSE